MNNIFGYTMLQSTWQYFDKTKCKNCLYNHKTLRNSEDPFKKYTCVAGRIGIWRLVVPAEKGEAEQNREKNNKLNPETAALPGYEPSHIVGRRVLLPQSTWPPPRQIGPEVWSRKWKPLASTLMPHCRGIYWHTLRKLPTIQHITLLPQCELWCHLTHKGITKRNGERIYSCSAQVKENWSRPYFTIEWILGKQRRGDCTRNWTTGNLQILGSYFYPIQIL